MPTAANLVTREDTLLGVCQGMGEEFGFNANYLRVAFGALLLWNAAVVVGVYLALGVVLAISRWWWPVRADGAASATSPALPLADNDPARVALAQAA